MNGIESDKQAFTAVGHSLAAQLQALTNKLDQMTARINSRLDELAQSTTNLQQRMGLVEQGQPMGMQHGPYTQAQSQ